LADYQNALAEFHSRNVDVIAASSDPRADAEKIQTDLGLQFPIAYELDPQATAAATGAFYDAEDEEPYLHATGFVIDAAGIIDTATYSTGSGGRLTVAEALRFTK